MLERGIEYKLSRTTTPTHNGIVERSHRTDEEDFYSITSCAALSQGELKASVKAWQDENNIQRLHSNCKYLPPMEHYLEGLTHVS